MPPNDRPRPYPAPGPGQPPRRRPAGQRRADRAEREEARWAAKYANATTPGRVAAVDFDRVRAAIRDIEDLDPQLAAARWAELSAVLRKLHDATRRDVARRRR
jgi:hypothetical protein